MTTAPSPQATGPIRVPGMPGLPGVLERFSRFPPYPTLPNRADVRGLGPLRATGDLELDGLTLGKGLVAVHVDGREVHEDVIPALAGDEAVPLLVAEPFDRAVGQPTSLLWTLPPTLPSALCRGTAAGSAQHTAGAQSIQAFGFRSNQTGVPRRPSEPFQATILAIGSSRMSNAP